MDHPGNAATITAAVALAVWGTGGSLYLRYRLLAPVREGAATALRHTAMAEATPDPLAERVHRSKAQDRVQANRCQLKRAERWNNRVYTPVTVALSAATIGLVVWGLL